MAVADADPSSNQGLWMNNEPSTVMMTKRSNDSEKASVIAMA